MVKRTQTIRKLLPTNCLGVFDHFVGLALKEINGVIKKYVTKFKVLPAKSYQSLNKVMLKKSHLGVFQQTIFMET